MKDRSGPSTQQPGLDTTAASSSAAVPPPPPPHRRPRVREVSSRFMSPVATSSSSSTSHAISSPRRTAELQRSKSVQRRLQDPEPLGRADENIDYDSIRSSLLGTPQGHSKSVHGGKQHQHPRAVVKLFKENGGAGARADHQQISDSTQSKGIIGNGKSSRPNTPMVVVNGNTDRVVSSRYRTTPHTSLHRPTPNSSGGGGTAVTAATKLLLQSSGMSSFSSQSSGEAITADDDDDKVATTCPDSVTVSVHNNKVRSLSVSDIRSSMPEVDMLLPTASNRSLMDKTSCRIDNGGDSDYAKFSAMSCSRSLNYPLPSSENFSISHSLKTSEKPSHSLSRSSSSSLKMGSFCLPPHPTCIKTVADARKGRKVVNHQEEVHSLKLLHNHCLQWRYANAKAAASMNAQKSETERQLYSLGVKISDLRNSVQRKRIELAVLRRTKTLSTIVEDHMPYLDEWSTMEEEYTTSLSGAIDALLNSSLRLPISGNVRADIREMESAMNSAMKVMETIVFHLQKFIPKGEEMDVTISELARVIGGEKNLVEECGDLLFKTHISQVEECSLRGHLMQLQHIANHNKRQEEEEEQEV